MATINVPFSIAAAATQVIPLDRWGAPRYTVQLTSSTAGTLLVEGTLQKVNQGETPTWSTINGTIGTTLTALATVADPNMVVIAEGPYEALRLTATGATVTGTVMQTGAC